LVKIKKIYELFVKLKKKDFFCLVLSKIYFFRDYYLLRKFHNQIKSKKINNKLSVRGNYPVFANKYASFTLVFDDLSPRSRVNSKYDDGGLPNKGINKLFSDFISNYPHLKCTMFLIPEISTDSEGWCKSQINYDSRFNITKYPSFLKYWKGFKNIELAIHGTYHYQKDVFYFPYKEFEYKSFSSTKKHLTYSISVFNKANIKFSGFKPPAWAIGQLPNPNLVNCLSQLNSFDYVCLSRPGEGLNKYENIVSDTFITSFNSLINIPTNIFLSEDLSTIFKKIDFIYKQKGNIVLQGHFTSSDRLPDGVDNSNILKLEKVLKYLKKYPNIKYLKLNQLLSNIKK